MKSENTLKFIIPKKDLAMFKYILESYENLCSLSTVDAKKNIVEVYIPKGNETAIGLIIKDLKEKIDFMEVK